VDILCFLASINLAIWILAWRFLPETKEKKLEDTSAYFQDLLLFHPSKTMESTATPDSFFVWSWIFTVVFRSVARTDSTRRGEYMKDHNKAE
jgi:hypothetical protein